MGFSNPMTTWFFSIVAFIYGEILAVLVFEGWGEESYFGRWEFVLQEVQFVTVMSLLVTFLTFLGWEDQIPKSSLQRAFRKHGWILLLGCAIVIPLWVYYNRFFFIGYKPIMQWQEANAESLVIWFSSTVAILATTSGLLRVPLIREHMKY